MPTPITPEALRRVPKVLLHDHLDGGLRPATVVELARATGYGELPTTDAAGLGAWFRDAADSGSLERYLETFAHTVGVMQTPESLRQGAGAGAAAPAAAGVGHPQVRLAPQLPVQQGL